MGFALALSLSLLLPLPLEAQSPAPSAAPAQTPGPQPGLLRGSESTSRVRYAADPKTVFELRYAAAGEAHQRLWLGGKDLPTRLMRFWNVDQGLGVDIASGRSAPLEGAQRLELRAQLELRRALVEFDRFAWEQAGEERRTTLKLSGSERALGTLVAREWNAASQRPATLVFLAADGQALDSFRKIEWRERQPLSCEFWHGETRIWNESEFRIEARTFTPDYFAPADRRATEGVRAQAAVITTQVPEHALRRVELKPGTTLEQARQQLESLRLEAEQAGLRLENRASLELDAQLWPRAVLLRLEQLPESLPAGYERRPASVALGVQVAGFEALRPQALAPLLERLPKGEEPKPYLRWLLVPGGEQQLLLLVPAPKG